MADIDSAKREFREMDDLAMGDSFVHGLHPLAKLIVTIAYIFIVASFDKYSLFGLFAMVIYPAFMFSASGVPARKCFYKLRFIF